MKPDKDTDKENKGWKMGQDENFICIGWAELGDITNFSELDKDALVEKIKKTYRSYSDKQANIAANHIIRFLHGLNKNHIVIMPTYPEKIIYKIGKINDSRAKYDDNLYIVTRKNVKWIKNVPRERLSEPLKNSLSAHLTVYNVDKHKEEIERLIRWKGHTSLSS